jgi:hypothetical protein
MKFWISRDTTPLKVYGLWVRKPSKNLSGDYMDWGFNNGILVCPDVFHRITDIRLKPGECREFDGVFTVKRKRGGK